MRDLTPQLTLPVDLEIRVTTPWGGGGRSLNFVLNSPSGAVDFHQEAVGGKELHNPEEFQQKLFQQLESLQLGHDVDCEGVKRKDILQELTTIGHDLYRMLFPREMQRIYHEVRDHIHTVLVTSDEPWIPWEILRPFDDDDDDFLCMKFQMSRWLTGQTSLASQKRIERLVCVEAGEEAGLASASMELQFFRELVSATPGLDGLFEPHAASQDVMRLLEHEAFDLIHFVGHGEYDDARPSESKVNLEDRSFRSRQIPPMAEKKLKRDRPVVFLNACQVGQLNWSLTDLDGWAPRWINRCGCSAFIAPAWSVGDRRAFEFARVFYEKIHEGRTLGEAVLLTRHKLRDDDPSDMTWLAYRLYGHPNAEILLGSTDSFATPKIPIAAPKSVPAEDSKPPWQTSAGQYRQGGGVRGGKSRKSLASMAVILVSTCFAAGLSWMVSNKWLESSPSGTEIFVPPVVDERKNEEPEAEHGALPGLSQDVETQAKTSGTVMPSRGVEQPPPPPPKTPPKIESTEERVPIQIIIPGKMGIVVFDRSTRRPYVDVADAVDAMLTIAVESIFPVVLEMNDTDFLSVSGGDLSLFPGGDRSPWGVEFLLLATASRKSTSRAGSALESVVLTMKSHLVDAKIKTVNVRSSSTHTGQGASVDEALVQATERCLREIINFINEEYGHESVT